MKQIFALLFMAISLAACSQIEDSNYKISQEKDAVVAVLISDTTDDKKGGVGTGFFIKENYIVTNYHVGGDPNTTLKIAMEQGSKMYDAELVLGDKDTDVAIIKLKNWEEFKKENPQIKYLTFASENPHVTDTVWAIGHPWGLFYSISRGIVSIDATKNPAPFPMWWIQTDAHVFQGNSGGPLLNNDGEVVGMNSNMYAREGGSYGFAIPTPLIKKIIHDLETYKEVRWASMGVGLEGTKISSVAPGSAAEKAGIKPNDIVTAVAKNGQVFVDVNDSLDLIKYLSALDHKDTVVLEISRDNDPISIKVTPDYKTSKDYGNN